MKWRDGSWKRLTVDKHYSNQPKLEKTQINTTRNDKGKSKDEGKGLKLFFFKEQKHSLQVDPFSYVSK